MTKVRFFAPVLAAAALPLLAEAGTITEDFTTDPLQNGWHCFGDTNLFRWDPASHHLAVTWDSTRSNSFFYHPLDNYLTRYDDFGFEFDLRLSDAASGVEAGKTTALQVALGFLNLGVATNTGFVRGMGLVSDIAEFCYYPQGYYEWPPGTTNDSPPSVVPSFVSSATTFAPGFLNPYYVLALPTNQLLHVSMSFTATNQTAAIQLTANGLPLGPLPSLVLNAASNSYFAATDDFRVDVFSISSYSSAGDPYDSLLAHGLVGNLRVSLPPPAQQLRSELVSGNWQVRFANKTNWLYTLQRTTDLTNWLDVSPHAAGNGGVLVLPDTNAPAPKAFYRVRAQRP